MNMLFSFIASAFCGLLIGALATFVFGGIEYISSSGYNNQWMPFLHYQKTCAMLFMPCGCFGVILGAVFSFTKNFK